MEKVELNINITDEMIDGILETAFEGGSNYWLSAVRRDSGNTIATPTKARSVSKGGALLLFADDEPTTPVKITRELMVEGITKAAVQNPNILLELSDYENLAGVYIDAGVADSILQFAAFGKLIYG